MKWRIKMSSHLERLESFQKSVHAQVWRDIGEAARSIIHEDTQLGKDWNGKRFKKYSPLYRRTRGKAGYPTKPDLTVTGNMLNSMSVVGVTSNSVTIGFIDRPSTGRTLLEKAWPKLSRKDRVAYAALASISKRKAGKAPGVRGRSNPSARKGKRKRSQPQMPKSDHPTLLPSEKMQMTNRLRPWFGFGKQRSKRRRRIQEEGFQIYIEGLTRHGVGRN